MNDIINRSDIEFVINEFYKKILNDDEISYVFNSVFNKGWETHISQICDFWELTLLGTGKYNGNPMKKHLDFNKQLNITRIHLEKWLFHWNTTLDNNYEGENTNELKKRAKLIGELILFKIEKQ